jgi:hypothetical protein
MFLLYIVAVLPACASQRQYCSFWFIVVLLCSCGDFFLCPSIVNFLSPRALVSSRSPASHLALCREVQYLPYCSSIVHLFTSFLPLCCVLLALALPVSPPKQRKINAYHCIFISSCMRLYNVHGRCGTIRKPIFCISIFKVLLFRYTGSVLVGRISTRWHSQKIGTYPRCALSY